MIEIILGIVGVIIVIAIWFAIATYKVVGPSEAHIVASGNAKFVVSSDDTLSTTHKRSYFDIPILRKVRVLDLTIKELESDHETYEKNNARFRVKASLKYRINNPLLAAETYTDAQNLNTLLEPIVQSGVRDITVKYDIDTVRSSKQVMETEMRQRIGNDLAAWGCVLINFQLIDFADTIDSKAISNISRRREVEIESKTRQENAEKLKQASMVESENTELAETRKIQMNEAIAKRDQEKATTVAQQEKVAQEAKYEVIRTQTIQQANITKEQVIIQSEQAKQQAIIAAQQAKEREEIMKQQKALAGEGNKLQAEQDALAVAAPIKQKLIAEAEGRKAQMIAEADGNKAQMIAQAEGMLAQLTAEAKGKTDLQVALSKFNDDAIRALIAEKIVAMQQTVGVANAEALKEAKINAFMGSGDKGAFDFGQLMASLQASNQGTANAVLNRLAKPNDLGLGSMSIGVNSTPATK